MLFAVLGVMRGGQGKLRRDARHGSCLPEFIVLSQSHTHTHTHAHTHTRAHVLNISTKENVIKFPKSRLGSEIQRREKSEWIREISHGG